MNTQAHSFTSDLATKWVRAFWILELERRDSGSLIWIHLICIHSSFKSIFFFAQKYTIAGLTYVQATSKSGHTPKHQQAGHKVFSKGFRGTHTWSSSLTTTAKQKQKQQLQKLLNPALEDQVEKVVVHRAGKESINDFVRK